MTVWCVVVALVVVCAAMRAAGAAVLGERQLPDPARRVVAVLAPALLAGLVVTEVAGQRWENLDSAMATGVLAAGLAHMLRAPALLAVALGAAVAAGMRLLAT